MPNWKRNQTIRPTTSHSPAHRLHLLSISDNNNYLSWSPLSASGTTVRVTCLSFYLSQQHKCKGQVMCISQKMNLSWEKLRNLSKRSPAAVARLPPLWPQLPGMFPPWLKLPQTTAAPVLHKAPSSLCFLSPQSSFLLLLTLGLSDHSVWLFHTSIPYNQLPELIGKI